MIIYAYDTAPEKSRAKKELGSLELGVEIVWHQIKRGQDGRWGLPVFELFYNKDDKYISRFVGYSNKKAFISWIKRFIDGSKTTF